MSDEIREKITSLDPAGLHTVVSQALNDPQIQITGWSAGILNNQGVMNADGPWLFHSNAVTGSGETR